MYISMKKAAIKYDVHVDSIRNLIKDMQINIDYIRVLDGRYRFNIANLDNKIKCKSKNIEDIDIDIDISKYLS